MRDFVKTPPMAVWVATVPLIGNPWESLGCGELVSIRDGDIVVRDQAVGAGCHAL
jgi:hypothetical protein